MLKIFRRNDPIPRCCTLIVRMRYNSMILIFIAPIDNEICKIDDSICYNTYIQGVYVSVYMMY